MTPQQEVVLRGEQPELSPALAEAGVAIAHDEAGGFRSISFPDDVRNRFNLLLPVQEIVQADPNYTPTIRAVKLNPLKDGPHFYNQSGKLAPRKQALEVLADAAGVKVARARPMSKEELSAWPEGTIGYEATVVLRRSDGTSKTLTATRIWERPVEEARIKAEVQAAKPQASEQELIAEFRKRWLQEGQHKAAKTESKAILRAIRSALQIPHTFSAADAAKPFVVVGYSYTPDYTDPEVVRLVTERQLGAAEELYSSAGRLELEAGLESARDGAPSGKPAEPAAPAQEEGPRASQPAGPSSAFEGEEPEAAAEPEPQPEEPSEAPGPGAFVLPEAFSKHAGKTIAEIAAEGDSAYLSWLASDKVAEPFRGAAQAFLAAELQKEA